MGSAPNLRLENALSIRVADCPGLHQPVQIAPATERNPKGCGGASFAIGLLQKEAVGRYTLSPYLMIEVLSGVAERRGLLAATRHNKTANWGEGRRKF